MKDKLQLQLCSLYCCGRWSRTSYKEKQEMNAVFNESGHVRRTIRKGYSFNADPWWCKMSKLLSGSQMRNTSPSCKAEWSGSKSYQPISQICFYNFPKLRRLWKRINLWHKDKIRLMNYYSIMHQPYLNIKYYTNIYIYISIYTSRLRQPLCNLNILLFI